mgnify:FL=1|tara:strand:+ start:3790 stop:4059 length:270 start_codon:yes stop_codon:yes gene_type:complete
MILENYEGYEELVIADGLDEAIMGVCRRFGEPDVVAYDFLKVLNILVDRDGMSPEEAFEFFEYNIIGAGMGEKTPVFIDSSMYSNLPEQ